MEAGAVERSTPFPVAIAAMVALATAAFLLFMGVIGVASANSVSDSFGVGVLIFGIVYAVAGYLLFRGSRPARAIIAGLSLIAAVVAVIYAFSGPTAAIVPSLVTAALALGVIVLLYLPESSKAHFQHR